MKRQDFESTFLRYSNFVTGSSPDFADPGVVDYWYYHIGDYPAEMLRTALNDLCTEANFPSIEKITEHIHGFQVCPYCSGNLPETLRKLKNGIKMRVIKK